MSQSSTLFIGMDVHNDAMAVADVAPAHGAEVTDLGTIGTRQGDLDPRIRKMPSQATPRLCVYAAGPCGDWLDRDLTTKGDDGWVVAPSRLPKQPGDRVTTDRRDAVPLARLARAGALPAVDVPTVADDAMRDLARARETLAVICNPPRAGSRPSGSATLSATRAGPPGVRPTCGGSRTWCVPPRRSPSSVTQMSVPFMNRPHDASVSPQHVTTRSQRGACRRSSQPCRPCAACRAPWP
jgi:hypothetical protein